MARFYNFFSLTWKRSSLLQRWRCCCKFKSRRIGSWLQQECSLNQTFEMVKHSLPKKHARSIHRGKKDDTWQRCLFIEPFYRVARFFLVPTWYQNRKNVPNKHKVYQIVIKYPSKIYPNWYFWFENKPSGNPVLQSFASTLKHSF
jgi:hypothetical protein